MDIEYTLIENSLDFLMHSINNLKIVRTDAPEEDIRKRLLKYSLLNLSSGIELLFKYRLLQENWTYIFADMNKASKVSFESGDFKSVDSLTSRERLKNLCDIKFDKNEEMVLDNLRKRRNRVEHFTIKETVQSVESIMIDSLKMALSFLAAHFKINEFSDLEYELFDQINKDISELEELVSSREKLIVSTAKQNGEFEHFITCPECLKNYLYSYDGEIQCRFCYYEDTPENVADAYLMNVLGISSYVCGKEQGEYPLYECPECGADSYVCDYTTKFSYCFSCGFTTPVKNIHNCQRCSILFYSVEDEEPIGICSTCIKDMLDNE